VASARLVGRGGRAATTRFSDFTNSHGAGESGLGRLSQLHASHTAGDTILTLALAGTIFYSPTTNQARSEVAFFLFLTMVPFALLAPFIGPLLDRFRHGRRWAIGTTLAIRAFLSWVIADLVNTDSAWLFPAALTVLVASRAYTVSRAAVVPRLLPVGTTLVEANSRMSMAGVVGAVLGAGLGGLAMLAGPGWALRLAFVVFVFGTVQAIRLPARVDSSIGEVHPEDTAPLPVAERRGTGEPAARHTPHEAHEPHEPHEPLTVDSVGPLARLRRRTRAIPWPVRHSLWSTGGTRILTGFLITFLAFLAKEHPVDGLRPELILGIVLAASGIGNALGNVVASRLEDVVKDHRPERVAMISILAATFSCIAVALSYALWTLVLVGFVQGVASQVAKLCFDALVQRDIAENVRASVFAWSETLLQMQWVLGGALGIALPLNPQLGFSVAAAALIGTILLAARTRMVVSRERSGATGRR
jgi:MFS family permease